MEDSLTDAFDRLLKVDHGRFIEAMRVLEDELNSAICDLVKAAEKGEAFARIWEGYCKGLISAYQYLEAFERVVLLIEDTELPPPPP